MTHNPPLSLGEFGRLAFVPEGFQMPRDRESFHSLMDSVDEGFFETMGIPILRGRGFQASDTAAAPRVAIVNEHFARHYWPGADPVGKRIRLESASGAPVEIVGITPTIKYSPTMRSISSTSRSASIRSRAWSCWPGRTAIRRSSSSP